MRGVVVLLLIFLCAPVYSQFLVGPKAGFQLSKVSYIDEDYKEANKTLFKPGYNAGLVLNYKASKTFSLHTELFYSRKGKIEKQKGLNTKNVASYHFIDLPLLLRISHHKKIKKQNIEFYFNTGPSFGYWLGGSGKMRSIEFKEYIDVETIDYKIQFGKVDEINYGETEYVPNPNKLQLEVNIGGGLVFEMSGKQKLMVDLRYGFGIGHTFLGEKEGGDFGLAGYKDNFEAVNHIISISVAYLYEFNLIQSLKKGKTKNKASK